MQKTQQFLDFKAPCGELIRFPVGRIVGDAPGPHFVITAGVHGAEYPGIAAAMTLFQMLEPEMVKGQVTIVTISSLEAFQKRSIFICPFDGKNPNRVFPGKLDGTYTDALAYYLFNEIIRHGDYYLDLHGGDMVEALLPFSIYHTGSEVDERSRELAEYYLLPNIIATSSGGTWDDSGTTYSNAAKLGIPAAIVESGGIGQMDQASIDEHMRGLINVLRHYNVLDGPVTKPDNTVFYRDFLWLYTPKGGVFHHMVDVGESVKAGQTAGIVKDYFGNQLTEILVPEDSRVLFRTTSPAVAENGLLYGLGVQ